MGLFKHKDKSELDLELKKFPKRQRKHLRDLYSQYEKGMVLQPGKDIDNKEYINKRKLL